MSDTTLREAPSTSAELVAQKLREDIRTGALRPAEKLQLRSLCERYGVSSSPIREALSRLTSEGLVTASGQRGFWVAPASHDDLFDILQSRIVIEGAALRRSVALGGEAWELDVLAALHRLKKHAQRCDYSMPWVDEWEILHKAFHMSLISGCGSRRMQEMSARLYDESERYRRLYWNYQLPKEELISEHQALVDIVLSRDAEPAVEAHIRHMDLTLELVAKLQTGTSVEK